jgi:hypothetical protein
VSTRPDDRRGSTRGQHAHNGGARGLAARILHAWRALHSDQRLAAVAAIGLFVSMLLPWYTKTGIFVVKGATKTANGSFTAFGAFSFVEAAVLLVSVFVLGILFARAEDRAFHLPGGDGTIVMLAGAWAAVLIFYRMLDKPGLHNSGVLYTEGISWGIFVALFVALLLTYAGWRMRLAARPEPPLLLAADDPRPRGPVEVLDPDGDPQGAEPQAAASAAVADAAPLADAHPTSRAAPVPATAAGRAEAAAQEDPDDAPPRRRPRYPEPPPADQPPRRAVTREDAAQLSFDDPPVTEPFAEDPPVARRRR